MAKTPTKNTGASKTKNKDSKVVELKERIGKQVDAQLEHEAKEYGSGIKPITPTDTNIEDRISEEPSARAYLFQDLLPAGIVGALVSRGGTGKSFLLLQMAMSLAAGHDFGPFRPARSTKVLYLGGEDPEDELWRRIYVTADKTWDGSHPLGLTENMFAHSCCGRIGPLLSLDGGGNPLRTEWFDWLCESIEAHKDLECLILDPLSRFYGLQENDNSHAHAWVSCLEFLTMQYDLTVLYSHHESKARAGNMDQSSSRGASALTDDARWVAAIRGMKEADAKRLEIENPRQFLEFDVVKSNYAPSLPSTKFFKRGDGGVLEYSSLVADRQRDISDYLLELLTDEDQEMTRQDLAKGKAGKEIADALKVEFPSFTRSRDMHDAIEYLLEQGWLESKRRQPEGERGGRPYNVLLPKSRQ